MPYRQLQVGGLWDSNQRPSAPNTTNNPPHPWHHHRTLRARPIPKRTSV